MLIAKFYHLNSDFYTTTIMAFRYGPNILPMDYLIIHFFFFLNCVRITDVTNKSTKTIIDFRTENIIIALCQPRFRI